MLDNISSFIVLFIVSISISVSVYFIVQKSLRNLLADIIELPSGITFYIRLFFICLLFIALSSALETEFVLKEDAAFMEYIWRIADGLSSVFGNICLFIAGYLSLVTVLIAVIRNKHVK